MKDQTPFQVQLLGQKIALKALATSPDAEEILRLVNERIRNAESKNRDRIPQHVVLMALLDLAEDYVKAKSKVSSHQKALEQKTHQLLEILRDHGTNSG